MERIGHANFEYPEVSEVGLFHLKGKMIDDCWPIGQW